MRTMKKTMIGIWAVGAMLCCTLSVQAVPKLDRTSMEMPVVELAPGQSPNSGSIDDDCTTGGFALGTLTPYMVINTNTAGLIDDFGCDPGCATNCPGGCGFFGGADADGVAVFQVPTSGMWKFSGCASVNYDSALVIRTGGVCPGAACVAQDGDSCAACASPYKAVVTANLLTGQDYYLIVDGYSGTGGPIDLRVTGPCTTAADCSDGIYCNGPEACTLGQCADAADPCTGTTPLCDEATDTCSGCSSNPAACVDDALFCNGLGVCLPTGACGQAGNPCTAFQTCNETTNVCIDFDPCVTFRNSDFGLPGNFFPQCTNANCNTSPTGNYSYGDDVELAKHSSRLVTSYSFYTQGRDLSTNPACNNNGTGPIGPPGPIGTAYTVNAALFTVAPGSCFPDALIPGSQCSVSPGAVSAGGTNAQVVTCNLAVPVAVPDGIDTMSCFDGVATFTNPCTSDGDCLVTEFCADDTTSQCDVDFYIVMNSNLDGVGPSIGCTSLIGGPGVADELADDAMIFATCSAPPSVWNGWRFALAGPGGTNPCPVNRGNWRGEQVCTVPTGACCNPTAGTCSTATEDDCLAAGGTYLGDIAADGSGGCDDGVDTDSDGSRDECDLCDTDPLKTAPGQCGCGNPDTDTDLDGTANCNDLCPTDPGKIAPGVCGCGVSDVDSDGDGTSDCQDGCPDDPNKTAPGTCGCGVSEGVDSDGDGILDCVDQCPGVDDAVFFPGCQGAIPTVSEWGMVVLALLLLAGAKVYFGRRTVQA